VFDILDYSKQRGMGNSHKSFIRSESFTVGGYDWAIRFYPDGYGKSSKDYISVYLELLSEIEVMASCDLRLVDQRTRLASSVHKTGTRIFRSHGHTKFAPDFSSFKKRSKIENSDYLRDDRLTIECVVTVIKPRQLLPQPNLSPGSTCHRRT
jgi:speckle-type POZ protein